MDHAEAELLKLGIDAQRAGWVEETYITPDTEAIAAQAGERVIARSTELIYESRRFDSLDLPSDLRRKFKLLQFGLTMPAPKDPALRAELTNIATSLEASYGSGKYCVGGDQS